jgi:hypothetical protein
MLGDEPVGVAEVGKVVRARRLLVVVAVSGFQRRGGSGRLVPGHVAGNSSYLFGL